LKAFPPLEKTLKGRFETLKITRKKMQYSGNLALLEGCRDRKEAMFIENISIQDKPQTMKNQDFDGTMLSDTKKM
jgi:hypothetical protein